MARAVGMSTSGSRQAQLRKLMRERAGGLKAGGVSIKEKYKVASCASAPRPFTLLAVSP